MHKKILAFLLIGILFSGCSWKSYDPDNPEEYHDYWAKEKNRKNSMLYRVVGEDKEETPRELRDLEKP